MNDYKNRKPKIKCELYRDSMQEVWKDIPEYKGFYQASNLGQIRSVDRRISQLANGGKTRFTYTKKGKILSQEKQNGGYLVVSICVNNRRKVCTVHRLVASAFIENPNGHEEVNHRDGDKTNNRVENLEWLSRSENLKHSYRTLKRKGNRKPIICIETKRVYSSCKEASDKTGINVSSINHAVNGLYETAGGFRWERI